MKLRLLLITLLFLSCNARKFELAENYIEKIKTGNLKPDSSLFYNKELICSEFDNRQMFELLQCADKYHITTRKYRGNFEIVYNFKCNKVKDHFDRDTISKIIFVFNSLPKWETKFSLIYGNFYIPQ